MVKRVVCLLPLVGSLASACTTAGSQPSAPPRHGSAEAPEPVTNDDQATQIPEKLAAEHISPVVASAAPRVKDQCWQPSLDSRAPDAPAAARVLVQAEIDPSGSVTAVHTNETPAAYPQLADCVVNIVRALRFHRALTSTIVNIPFEFDAKGKTPPR